MPKPDPSIPPALRTLGGWEDAEWFCASILSEEEVVGLTLPKLPGGRKQNFHLVERSAPQAAPKTRRGRASPPEAKAPPNGIGPILDGLRVNRAAAFRKPTFFFDGPPVLFFADIPAANLKVRAADGLRRDLIQNALRGCVVRQDGKSVVAMFWPSSEADITTFVRAAAPPHALHPQFLQAEAERAVTKRPPNEPVAMRPARERDRRVYEAERASLMQELDTLRARIAVLQQSQSALGAMEALGLDDTRLKSMLILLHPDKHANSAAATEAATWVNGLRDLLRAAR